MTFSGGNSYQGNETSSFDLIFRAKDEASAAVDRISTSVKSVGTVAIASATAVSAFMRSFSPGALGGAAAGLTVLYRSVQLIKTTLESAPAQTLFSLLEQQAQDALSEIRPLSELMGALGRTGLTFGAGFLGGVKESVFGAARTMEDRFDTVGRKIEVGLQGSLLKGLNAGSIFLPKFIDATAKKLQSISAEIDLGGIKQDLQNYETGILGVLNKAESFGKLSLAKGLKGIATGLAGGNEILKSFINPQQVGGLADSIERTLSDSIVDRFLKRKLPDAAEAAYKFAFGTELSKAVGDGLRNSRIAEALPPFVSTILGGIDREGSLYKAIGDKAASILKKSFSGFEEGAGRQIDKIFDSLQESTQNAAQARDLTAAKTIFSLLDNASNNQIRSGIKSLSEFISKELTASFASTDGKQLDGLNKRLLDAINISSLLGDQFQKLASSGFEKTFKGLSIDLIDQGLGLIPQQIKDLYAGIRQLFPKEISGLENQIAQGLGNSFKKFQEFLAGPAGQIESQRRIVDQLNQATGFDDQNTELQAAKAKLDELVVAYTQKTDAIKALQDEAIQIALNPDLATTQKNSIITGLNKQIREAELQIKAPLAKFARNIDSFLIDNLGFDENTNILDDFVKSLERQSELLRDQARTGARGFVQSQSTLGSTVGKVASSAFGAFFKLDSFLEGSITNTALNIGKKFGIAFAGTAATFIGKTISPAINAIGDRVAAQFIKIPQEAQQIIGVVKSVENAASALSGVDEPLELFRGIKEAAQQAVGSIFQLTEQFFFLQAGLSSIQQLGRAPFDFLIGQTIELRRQILATQATIAATNKVFADGFEIKDSGSKIRALSAPLLAGFAEIRRESLKISGITSNELAEILSQVGSNISAIGGSIKDATDLTLKFGAGLTVLGIPLAQSRQEILSILQGTIDQNSVLAKSLNISNEQLQSWVNQGRAVRQLNSRLEALAAGSELAANEFAGVTSNIREIIDEFGRLTGARFLDPILKQLNQLFEKIQSGPGQINRELLAYGEQLSALVERIGKAGYAIITTLIGSFKELGAAVPIYLLTAAAQGFEILAQTITITVQALQPAINVLAKIFELVAKNEELFGVVFKVAVATKVLSGALNLLNGGFGTLAKIIPIFGDALFVFKIATAESVKEFLNLQKILTQGGRSGWGAAGFLTLGKNLQNIPGAVDFVNQKFGALGGIAVALIPKISGFASTLLALGAQFPLLGTAIDIGVKIILKSAPRVLNFLATLAETAVIAGVALKPLAQGLREAAVSVQNFEAQVNRAGFFNQKFQSTLLGVGQAAGKAAVGLALSIAKFAAFFVAADVAFKLFERFTAKSTTDIADAAAKTSKDLEKMRQAWNSTSKDLATSPKISVEVLEGEDYLDKIIEKLREVLNLKGLLNKPEDAEAKLLQETGVRLKNFERDFENLQALIQQNGGAINKDLAASLSSRVDAQLQQSLNDPKLDPKVKAKIKELSEKINQSLREAARNTQTTLFPTTDRFGRITNEIPLPKAEQLKNSTEQARKAREAFKELQDLLDKNAPPAASTRSIEDLGKALDEFKRKADGSGNTATKELNTFYESVLATFASSDVDRVTTESRKKIEERINGLVRNLPDSIPPDTKRELEKAILDAFPVGTDLKIFNDLRAFDGQFKQQFAGITQSIKENLGEGTTITQGALDQIGNQIAGLRIPVQQKEQLLDFLAREFPANARVSTNALRAFQARLEKLRPESLKVITEEVSQAIERTQAELDKLNKSGQGNTALAAQYKQALTGLESYKKQLLSLRTIQEKGDTANSKATQLQAETLKASIDREIDARRKTLDQLEQGGQGSSPLALTLRSEIIDLEKLNKELETYRANVQLVQNPLEQLKRLQAEFKRASEKATQELTIGETQRQITFQQLLNKGFIRQEQLEAAKIDLTRARLKEELKLAQDQEKKLDELLEKNPELIEEEEFQKQVRESRLKTAQLTLQLLEQEEAAYRKMIDLMRQRIERQSQAFANSLEPQKQALQDQLELLELVNKAIENRSRLVSAGKDLFGASVEFQRSTLDVLKQVERSEIRQRNLAQASAILRLQTLEKEIAFNERALEIEFEKNRLALEREEIQNRIARTEAEIQLNKSEGALEIAQKDKSATPEERERLRLEVEARRRQLKNLNDQDNFLQRQRESLPAIEDIRRRELSIKGDTQRLQARGQVFETLSPAQQAQFRRQFQDQITAQGGFGRNSDEFIRGVGQGLKQQLNEVFGKPVQRLNEQFRQVNDLRINAPVSGTEVLEQRRQPTPATPKDLIELQRLYAPKRAVPPGEDVLRRSVYRPDQGIQSATASMRQVVDELKNRVTGTTINLPPGAVQINATGADPKAVEERLTNNLGDIFRQAQQKVNQQP